MHAYLPLAILNVFVVGNELPKLVRHNNAQGRDEMVSLLFLSYDYYPWLPRCQSPGCCCNLHGLNEPVCLDMLTLAITPVFTHGGREGGEGADFCKAIGFR